MSVFSDQLINSPSHEETVWSPGTHSWFVLTSTVTLEILKDLSGVNSGFVADSVV